MNKKWIKLKATENIFATASLPCLSGCQSEISQEQGEDPCCPFFSSTFPYDLNVPDYGQREDIFLWISKIWISLVGLPTPPTPTAPYYPSDLLRMDSFIIRITIYIKSNINTAQYLLSGPLRMNFLMIWALITANDANGDISLHIWMLREITSLFSLIMTQLK